jgi:hypothetical protein
MDGAVVIRRNPKIVYREVADETERFLARLREGDLIAG